MRKKLFIRFLGLLTTVVLSPQSIWCADVCENIAPLSCEPQGRPDGTGASRNPQRGSDEEIFLLKSVPLNQQSPDQIRRLISMLAGDSTISKCNPQSLSRRCRRDLSKVLIANYFCTGMGSECNTFRYYFDLKKADPIFLQDLSQQMVKNLIVNKYKLPDRTAEINKLIGSKVFPRVKEILKKKINSYDIPVEAKKVMLEKLDRVRLGSPSCTVWVGPFEPNAFYEPSSSEIHICSSITRYSSSEFFLAYTIGHELSHSIDICNLYRSVQAPVLKRTLMESTSDFNRQYPLQNVEKCLRKEGSLQAKVGMDPCTDQLVEGIPDWFAAEGLSEYVSEEHPNLSTTQWRNGISNIFTFACPLGDSKGAADELIFSQDGHSPDFFRLNNVILAQPSIRQKMGCSVKSKTARYCPQQSSGVKEAGQETQRDSSGSVK